MLITASQRIGLDADKYAQKIIRRALLASYRQNALNHSIRRSKLVKWDELLDAMRTVGYLVPSHFKSNELIAKLLASVPHTLLSMRLQVDYKKTLQRWVNAMRKDEAHELGCGLGLKLIELYPEEAEKFLEDTEKFLHDFTKGSRLVKEDPINLISKYYKMNYKELQQC